MKIIHEPKILMKNGAFFVNFFFMRIMKNEKIFVKIVALHHITKNPHQNREILTNICMRDFNPDRRSIFS